MFDLCEIGVEGTIVTERAIKHLSGGLAVLKFGIVSKCKKCGTGKTEQTELYFTVSHIGAYSENLYKSLKTGQKVRVDGDYSDGTFRDRLTDEIKIGRIIYARRIKAFTVLSLRKPAKKHVQNSSEIQITEEDLRQLPF